MVDCVGRDERNSLLLSSRWYPQYALLSGWATHTRKNCLRILPQKLGGLSIRRVEDFCETGFASSLLESLPVIHENRPSQPAIIDRPETTPTPDSARLTINRAKEATLQEAADADDSIPERPSPNPISQSELTNIQDKARFLALFNDLYNFPKHLAWLQSWRDRNTAILTRYTICFFTDPLRPHK
jgi:hypothetical protein